ncbi:MAG: FkbM family methyltransferase [Luteolibacter sp.]
MKGIVINAFRYILRGITLSGISRGPIRKWINEAWYLTGADIVQAKINGIHYELHINQNTTDCKILTSSKFYDKRELEFLARAESGKGKRCFVDVGANIGYYSLNLAQMGVEKIVAIEPNPPTREILQRNIAANEQGKTIAVSDFCVGAGGEIPFYMSGELGSASVFEEDHTGSCVMVKSAPLKQIVQENGIEGITCMKLDIEGYEDRALRPFFESTERDLWPQRMIIEHCNSEKWEPDFEAYLDSIGFRTVKKTRANLFLQLAI